jgi:crossover junction endodeoxyribonuclease RuvC
MTTHVIGVDPGLSGAIALLGSRGLLACADIPLATKGSGQATIKTEVNAAGLAQILRGWTNGGADDVLVVIERQSAKPTIIGGVRIPQGGASIFSTGDTYGVIRGVVAALTYPAEFVTAGQWKKHYELPGGREQKELARARAIQLYPAADLHRKKDHGRAEAILIARYGWDELR